MDFKILRKRRRSAIDPCLGYYEPAVNPRRHRQDEEATERDQTNVHALGSRSSRLAIASKPLSRISEIAHISSENLPQFLPIASPTPTHIAQVTVNDFLSRNGKHGGQKPQKRYSSKRRTMNRETHDAGTRSEKESKDEDSSEPWYMPDIRDGSNDEADISRPRIQLALENEDEESGSERRNLRLRSRIVRSRVISSGSEDESSSTASTGSEFIGSPSRKQNTTTEGTKAMKKKATRKGLITKTMGTRLFEASVATYGQPLDRLVLPASRSRKTASGDDITLEALVHKPLAFVPLVRDDPDEGYNRTLIRRTTLVDPRKASPFSQASFCSTSQLAAFTQGLRDGSEDTTKTYGRISKWKSRVAPPIVDCHQEQERQQQQLDSERKGPKSNGKRQQLQNRQEQVNSRAFYPPLEFVPLDSVNAARHDKRKKTKAKSESLDQV